MEVALFFYICIRQLMQWWAYLLNFFQKPPQFYYVDDDGVQREFDTLKSSNVLVVYSRPRKFLFLPNAIVTDLDAFKEAHQTYSEAALPYMGIEVVANDFSYSIDPHDFMVEGSTLFTPTFNKWMCRYVLGIDVTPLAVTVVDNDVQVVTIDRPIKVGKQI
jgi:hypothetical protein